MFATLRAATDMPVAARRLIKQYWPLALVVLLHIVFVYALQGGLLRQAAHALPKEVIASLIITPSPSAQHNLPHSATPKMAPSVNPTATAAAAATVTPQAISMEPTAPPEQSAQPAQAAPATPASPFPAQPMTVTSGIAYIQPPQPEYPAIAKRMGEEGKVILRVLVNEQGRAERIDVHKSSGYARLDEAARIAVSRAVFKPYLDDGKALAVYALVPIVFQLDH